jgi:hypothetical protein
LPVVYCWQSSQECWGNPPAILKTGSGQLDRSLFI